MSWNRSLFILQGKFYAWYSSLFVNCRLYSIRMHGISSEVQVKFLGWRFNQFFTWFFISWAKSRAVSVSLLCFSFQFFTFKNIGDNVQLKWREGKNIVRNCLLFVICLFLIRMNFISKLFHKGRFWLNFKIFMTLIFWKPSF